MNLYQQFSTNDGMEKGGIDLAYGDVKIRVARAGGSNHKYGKSITERMKPFKRAYETGTLSDEDSDKIMREVYADSIILGWENVTDKDGNYLEFNRENCIKLMSDLPELFRDIMAQSQKVANYRIEEIEADAKN